MNSSNTETAGIHWLPLLRYQKECEAAGKEALEKKALLKVDNEKTKKQFLENQD